MTAAATSFTASTTRTFARVTLLASAVVASLAACGCTRTFRFDPLEPEHDAGTDAATPPPIVYPCTRDEDCGLASLHCELGSGSCVACLDESHCTSPDLPVCEPGLHRCVACDGEGDCPEGFRCAGGTHRCVRTCAAPADCVDGERECVDGLCEQCDTRAQCASTPDTPVCDRRARTCVQCASEADCTAPTPFCDRATARCVACVDSAQCDGWTPWCDPQTHRCLAASGR